MNTQLINQIKELPGVKEVTEVNGMAVVVFEPRKPIYTDQEDGTEFFAGDEVWYFEESNNEVFDNECDENTNFFREDDLSKGYKTKKLCELALAKFIMDKYK